MSVKDMVELYDRFKSHVKEGERQLEEETSRPDGGRDFIVGMLNGSINSYDYAASDLYLWSSRKVKEAISEHVAKQEAEAEKAGANA